MRISDWSSDVCSSDLTTIAYGASGVANNLLPTQVTKAAGNGSGSATVKTAYDTIGDAISVDVPLSGSADTTTYRYDLDRRRLVLISPAPDGAVSLKLLAVLPSYADDVQFVYVFLGTFLVSYFIR